MNKTEKDLYEELSKGHVEEVLCHIPARYFEEELGEIMFLWSEYRNDPVKLVSKLNNQFAKLICEAANNIEEIEATQSDEDRLLDSYNAHQECLRDRRAEEGF